MAGRGKTCDGPYRVRRVIASQLDFKTSGVHHRGRIICILPMMTRLFSRRLVTLWSGWDAYGCASFAAQGTTVVCRVVSRYAESSLALPASTSHNIRRRP